MGLPDSAVTDSAAPDSAVTDSAAAPDVASDTATDVPADSGIDATARDVFAAVDAVTDALAVTDATLDGAVSDGSTGAGPYPAGPYGNTEGAVLANLSWEGYVNTTGTVVSTTLPYGPTSLQALRGTGRGYALVHLSEFY